MVSVFNECSVFTQTSWWQRMKLAKIKSIFWTFFKKSSFMPMLVWDKSKSGFKIKICQLRICDDMVSAILF
jgi:hypothetical protein